MTILVLIKVWTPLEEQFKEVKTDCILLPEKSLPGIVKLGTLDSNVCFTSVIHIHSF